MIVVAFEQSPPGKIVVVTLGEILCFGQRRKVAKVSNEAPQRVVCPVKKAEKSPMLDPAGLAPSGIQGGPPIPAGLVVCYNSLSLNKLHNAMVSNCFGACWSRLSNLNSIQAGA